MFVFVLDIENMFDIILKILVNVEGDYFCFWLKNLKNFFGI